VDEERTVKVSGSPPATREEGKGKNRAQALAIRRLARKRRRSISLSESGRGAKIGEKGGGGPAMHREEDAKGGREEVVKKDLLSRFRRPARGQRK